MTHLHPLTALVLLIATAVVPAQLSGTYTIDPNGSGPTNFISFGAATTALGTSGVSGPTVFDVAAGTITESWTIPMIPGTSSTNTVTFKGVAVLPNIYLNMLAGGATHIIDILPGANNVIIDGFDFTAANGLAIQAVATSSTPAGAATDIEIANCRFGAGIAGGASGRQHIYVEGRSNANNWIIRDCEFHMGTFNYGCYLSQVRFWLIHRCTFQLSGVNAGLYWINTNDARNVMCNNLFLGNTSTSTGACCINIAASNTNNDVCFNTFDVSTSGSVIRTFGHNNNNYNRLYGNIFNVQGTGSGINVTIASLNYWNSDGNLFNLPNGFVGEIAGIKYQTLSAWQVGSGLHPHGSQDMNSVSGDPKFVSATDRHLTPASPGLHKAVLYAGRHEPVEDREGWLRGTKQDIGAYEMTAYRHYAQGCPGSGSQIPELEIGGNVAPGENISLDLTNGLANRTAALALGVTAVSVPLGTGCNLLVNPVVVLFAQTSASGAVSLPTTIPAATPIVGLQVHLQGGVSDAAANGGLAFTAGVTVRM